MARSVMMKSWLGVVAVLAACGSPLIAQGVDGRVVRASDSAGVVGALVRLLDASGERVAQATTDTGGAFSLRTPTVGRYSVAVLRIGQRPWRSDVLYLAAGALRRLTFSVPDEPITLEAIPVETRSRCRTSPSEGSVVAQLLAEADKALTVARFAAARPVAGLVVEFYRRTQNRLFDTVDSIGTREYDVAWPINSVPPEVLAARGFVRDEGDGADAQRGQYTYYGPDAPVLLSQWFLSTHCFGVAEGADSDSGAVVVTFRPEGGRRADIEGRMVFARPTFELRRIAWRYVRLPWWVTLDGAAGEVVLDRLPSGAYLPSRWWMRAPIAWVNSGQEPVGVWGWRESGGRIVPSP